MKVRTRFAPSPTGFMHVGGARTALFSFLVAKAADGQFIIRIEDTDRSRHLETAERHILESLRWLGIKWDEEPYRQSQRLQIYRSWAEKLLSSDRAYPDPYSPEELEALRQKSKSEKKPFLFRGYRPDKTSDWDGEQPLRFKSEPKAYRWQDEVMGNLSTGPEAIDDFIIIKSDGYPTYNFAHVIDDHLMKISHVIRSQEFLPSVPKFLNLHEALAVKPPKMATLPYVMAPGGNKKLSKRDGAKDILGYREEGFLPEAMVNFLATLGWNDGTKQEIFSLQELVEKFELSRVQKSGAHFDEQRLVWMNGHYIRQMSVDELQAKIEKINPKFWGQGARRAASEKKTILALVQERLKHFSELEALSSFFFEEPTLAQVVGLYKKPVDKQLSKHSSIEGIRKMLQAGIAELQNSDFTTSDIKIRLNNLLTSLDTKPGMLFPILRIAVSGQPATPELFGSLSVLGKAETLKRLSRAADGLEK